MANANDAYRREQSERLAARISREKSLCEKVARLQGSILSEFAINSAVEAAKRTVPESEFMALTQRDRAAFVEALLNAPAPNDKLRRAAERHVKIFAE